jgi:hypothetical protein
MATGQELNYNTGASALDMALEIFGAGTRGRRRDLHGLVAILRDLHRRRQHRPRCDALRTAGSSSRRARDELHQSSGDPNRSASTSTNTPDRTTTLLNAAAGTNTFDAAILEVDFIPTGNVMTLQFQFASEEYPNTPAPRSTTSSPSG